MDKILAQMAVELRLMGYEVDMSTLERVDGAAAHFVAKSNNQSSFGILEDLTPGHYLAYSPIRTQRTKIEGTDSVIAAINNELLISRTRFDVRGGYINIFCEATFSGEYSGKLFENFIILFITDLERLKKSKVYKDSF